MRYVLFQKYYVKLAFGFIIIIIIGWAFFVFYSYYVDYEKQLNQRNMSKYLLSSAIVIADFVNETQKERGLSAAFLGNTNKKTRNKLSEELANQRNRVDTVWLITKKRLIGDLIFEYATIPMKQEIRSSIAMVDSLQNIRDKIDKSSITLHDELEFFNSLNENLLDLIPIASRITPIKEISQALQTYWTILKWKENVGIERGVIANLLASKEINESLYERVLIAHTMVSSNQKQVYLLLGDDWRQRFAVLLDDPLFELTNRYYEDIVSGIFSINTLEWFNVVTRKMDRFDLFLYSYRVSITKNLEQLEDESFRRLIIFMFGTITFVMFLLLVTYFLSRKILNMITDMQIASIVFEAQEGVTITDSKGIILKVNKTFETITGFKAEEVIGKKPSILKSGKQNEQYYKDMWNSAIHKGYWSGEIINKKKDESLINEFLSITTIYDHKKNVTHFVGIFSDISNQKEAQETIAKLAFFDPLTNLPNRRLLLDRLEHAIGRCAREKEFLGIAFIDLDHFKRINDTKGHSAGDAILIQTAERLLHSIRTIDTVARLGGDEFIVIFEGIGQNKDEAIHNATALSEKLLEILNLPYNISDEQIYITGSIGIALVSEENAKIDDIIAQADTAMYGAKDAGRNSFRFFDLSLQEIMSKQLLMETALRKAIKENEFFLLYQPQVNKKGIIVGAEALIRWDRIGHGLVSPADFIPIAEESHLIIDIGQWVVSEGCKTLATWKNLSYLSDIILSINISTPHFMDKDFIKTLRRLILQYRIDPKKLRIELTESVFAKDTKIVRKVMDEIHSLGVGLALDDFGTGYSSLSYLREFPLDEIKIDQSFTRKMTEKNSTNYSISKAIVAMGRALKLEVIAEGVETKQQFEWLMEMGCLYYQGYYFYKPISKDHLEEILKNSLE